MHHLAKLTFGKVDQLPFHAECACGTAGDFRSRQQGADYLVMHLTRLQGINSAEFVDETVAPVPAPAPEVEQPKKDEPVSEEKAEKDTDAADDEAEETAEEDAADAKASRKKGRGA
jgi:hypothetical protein